MVTLFDYQLWTHCGLSNAQSSICFSLAAPVALPTRPRVARSAFVFRRHTRRRLAGRPEDFWSGSYRQLAVDSEMDYRCSHSEVDSVGIYTRVWVVAEFLACFEPVEVCGRLN